MKRSVLPEDYTSIDMYNVHCTSTIKWNSLGKSINMLLIQNKRQKYGQKTKTSRKQLCSWNFVRFDYSDLEAASVKVGGSPGGGWGWSRSRPCSWTRTSPRQIYPPSVPFKNCLPCACIPYLFKFDISKTVPEETNYINHPVLSLW